MSNSEFSCSNYEDKSKIILGLCWHFHFTALASKKKPNKIMWTDDLDRTIKMLKGMLLSEPVLRSPYFGRPFILHTDASEKL